ncbi:Glu-specific serine endopeptidase SspA [Staphylococcus argenteus]|uniref:Glu-specific serine endopeptidase SspA n=1 Tax=Staphylococcus argenteus TaxID=985002 RepID=UPI00178C97AB|nr:Glu-specific serine endopeptidase SspA [Staphylococcus argenteus]MBE2135302.1 Glu-specific serine endopeptidase SspA [Staphylococcus argenteus]
MKGKFLKVSSLLVATLTTVTLVNSPSANALSSNSLDSHAKQTQSDKQQSPKIQKGNNLKPIEQREHANVILPNNDRHQIEDTTNGHYAPVTFIQVESATGTFIASGVVVGKDTLLTNKHVVDATHGNPQALTAFPSAKSQDNYPNGGFRAEQITKYTGEGDLAIVKFSPNDKNQHIGEVVKPATMSNNAETQVNQPITVTGYPGDKPVATMWESKGKITYLKGEAMQYDLSTTGGISGSPVFNDKNEVIGIHWGGVPNEFNGAVFINENVRNFLKENIQDIHFADGDNNNPDQPNNPDNPNNPDQPNNPDNPNNPDQPNNPDNPNNPDQPNNPDNGDNNNSDNPDAA